MIAHDSAFETLAVAPVKQTNVIVARQIQDTYGYIDDTLKWESSDALMEVKIDAVGQMLGMVTKKATVKLLGIQDGTKAGDVFQVRLGLYNDDPSVAGFDYISEGFYIVDTVEQNYDAGSTTITMYDPMWRAAEMNYAETIPSNAIEYPITVENFANKLAAILNITLMDDFDQLPNADYEITEDLYSNISGATIQSAITDIAGATGTTARISDTTLVFSQYEVSSENLNSDNLRTLKIGDVYGPVTSVILGRTPQNDNIAIYAANPTNSVVENVNPITDIITVSNSGMSTGNMVQFTSNANLPAPLVRNTSYYTYMVSGDDTFKLAPTYLDAINGTNLINLTTTGSGTISIVPLTTKEIQINNNEILDDDRQDLLPPLYNVLSGIDWSDVKADTVGLGWHEVGDVIQFTQGSTTARGFLSEVHLVLAGSIRENLVSTIPTTATIDYQAAGGILRTLNNTEIKVDKQANDITSIVSQQTSFENEMQEDFTQVYQNLTDILLTVQKSGGGNLISNSVGYALESAQDADDVQYQKLTLWDYNPAYAVADNGTITTYSSSESQNAGGVSGQVIEFNGDGIDIEQRIDVAANTPMCFGVRVNSALGYGGATITIYNDNDSRVVNIDDMSAYEWTELIIENFVSTMSWVKIKIETEDAIHLQLTDLRLLYGTTLQSWVQSATEILSTNVQFSKLGMKIFDNVHDTETQVTYNEFSTRRRSDGKVLFEADDAGVVTNDLSIKGVTNYMSGDSVVIKQITIPTGSARAGIAFIKVT